MASAEVSGVGAATGRLLEREGELAEVERMLARVGQGSGELLLVESPAGAGKTRLLEALGRAAGVQGMTVQIGRAHV